MENLLGTFNDRRTELIRRQIHLMGDFLTEFSKQKQVLDINRLNKFNILEILNISSDEVRHSAFLAWLLDANSGHNQGFLFFNAVMELSGIDIHIDHPYSYTVKKEFSGMESIIDILIYAKSDFLIYIENKVYSSEGNDQCAREERDMHRHGSRLNIPLGKQYAVFLTPDGRDPSTGNPRVWKSISYQQLGLVFKDLIPQISSDKVRFALEDWLDIIMNF